ncbi:MAG: Acyl carrier protein [Syntrophus sp. SKADARSKE-3]|nr:Acyl carrier protein [Syntrophus sp. SKADARSKE-3]
MNQQHSDTLKKIRTMLEEILDLEGQEISEETYLYRDLGTESIDLLELAVALNQGFGIKVQDDHVFLWRLRFYLVEAQKNGTDSLTHLVGKYPFLGSERIAEILDDLDNGPILKVKDIISYVEYQTGIIKGGQADGLSG